LKWGIANFLLKLALNHYPSDLHLPSSWNDRHELPYPT
jgi:hypothetical protein